MLVIIHSGILYFSGIHTERVNNWQVNLKLPHDFEVVAVIVEQKYNASRISLKTPISTAILKFEVVAKIVERKW